MVADEMLVALPDESDGVEVFASGSGGGGNRGGGGGGRAGGGGGRGAGGITFRGTGRNRGVVLNTAPRKRPVKGRAKKVAVAAKAVPRKVVRRRPVKKRR